MYPEAAKDSYSSEIALISDILRHVVATHMPPPNGVKSSSKILEPAIAQALEQHGFSADAQGSRQNDVGKRIYPDGVPPWREGPKARLVPGPNRRRIDVVAYRHERLAAFIESENDIDDIPVRGWRPSGYAVRSVARDANGIYFESYRSIERIAVAAFAYTRQGREPSQILSEIEAIASDEPGIHNPAGIPLFVVLAKTGDATTAKRVALIQKRLNSLGCQVLFK